MSAPRYWTDYSHDVPSLAPGELASLKGILLARTQVHHAGVDILSLSKLTSRELGLVDRGGLVGCVVKTRVSEERGAEEGGSEEAEKLHFY